MSDIVELDKQRPHMTIPLYVGPKETPKAAIIPVLAFELFVRGETPLSQIDNAETLFRNIVAEWMYKVHGYDFYPKEARS